MRPSSAIVALICALAISSCGSASQRTANSETPTTKTPATVAPTSDTGFGQSEADRAKLLSTTWLAQRFITVGPLDEIPVGSTAGFHFDDAATIIVDTGCNTGTATVTFGPGGTFTAADLTITEIACTDGVEPRILALFGQELAWSVDGDQLTIYPLATSDAGLILRDAESVSAAPTTTISSEQAAASARADIIAATALARLTVDNSFGGGAIFTDVAILSTFGEADSTATLTVDGDGVMLTKDERGAVEAALAPTSVRWTTDPQDPAILAAQAAGQLAAILTLSEPVIDGDSAMIVSGLFCGELCGIGGAFTLDGQSDGSWVVTGRPGPQWIS